MTQDNPEKAIDRVGIPGSPEVEINTENFVSIPEPIGFGYANEEEEKQSLIEEYGQEWVDENWVPWDELESENQEEEGA